MPEHGDVRTDDNDLVAIFLAVLNGFGLSQPEPKATSSNHRDPQGTG